MLINKKLDGALLAARYAFMPNKLRYCGGDKNSEIFDYVAESASDQGLKELLKEFATMYPYLKLIAAANKIANPFDYQVVEAYWLGNDLLNNVDLKNFYRYLVDEQKLKKQFKPKLLEKVFGKIALGAKPHHSWHVFNIPKRTGHYPIEHTLKTMDQCRIAAAKIKKTKILPLPEGEWHEVLMGWEKIKNTKTEFVDNILIEYQPLVIKNNKLELGDWTEKEVWSELNDKSFIKAPKAGDWVAIHWDWACDYLTATQLNNLQKWTKYNLDLVNF